jgi:hypothetical protein
VIGKFYPPTLVHVRKLDDTAHRLLSKTDNDSIVVVLGKPAHIADAPLDQKLPSVRWSQKEPSCVATQRSSSFSAFRTRLCGHPRWNPKRLASTGDATLKKHNCVQLLAPNDSRLISASLKEDDAERG